MGKSFMADPTHPKYHRFWIITWAICVIVSFMLGMVLFWDYYGNKSHDAVEFLANDLMVNYDFEVEKDLSDCGIGEIFKKYNISIVENGSKDYKNLKIKRNGPGDITIS